MPNIENLTSEEIKKALGIELHDLTDEHVVSIQDFISAAGSLESARKALEALRDAA